MYFLKLVERCVKRVGRVCDEVRVGVGLGVGVGVEVGIDVGVGFGALGRVEKCFQVKWSVSNVSR